MSIKINQFNCKCLLIHVCLCVCVCIINVGVFSMKNKKIFYKKIQKAITKRAAEKQD